MGEIVESLDFVPGIWQPWLWLLHLGEKFDFIPTPSRLVQTLGDSLARWRMGEGGVCFVHWDSDAVY